MVESQTSSGLGRRTTERLRLPPHSLEAERSLLGGLMLDQRAWDMIADAVESTDFYRADHRLIFDAVATLVEREQPPDAVTVAEALSRQGQLEAAGGLDYLAQLVAETPSAANIRAYARIVRERAMLRQLIQIGGDIAASALDEEGRTVDELVDLAEQRVFEIAERGQRRGSGFIALKHILPKTIDRLDVLSHSEGDVTGVSTGFGDMDRFTAGLQRGDLVIIAGRPSMGKCIVAGSRILDPATGRLETIDARVRERRGRLVSVDRRGRLRAAAASAFVDDGIKPVFEVRTALGRRITVTASHPFLTLEGWQPLAALRVGTHVGVPRTLPFFGSRRLPEPLVKLAARTLGAAPPRHEQGVPAPIFELPREQLAFFLHEAFAHCGRLEVRDGEARVSYSTPSEATARDLQHLLLRFGIVAALRRRAIRDSGQARLGFELEMVRAEAARFVREVGSFGAQQAAADALHARLPACARQRAVGVDVAVAVDVDVDADVVKGNAASPSAGGPWGTAVESEAIPADVWALIAAKKGARSWDVIVEAAALVDDGEGPERKAEPTASDAPIARASTSRGRGMSRRCLRRIAEALDDDELRHLAESDIHWDRIEAIRYVGPRQVYDLTVPEQHNFVAEDVIVHNTTFAMNIAENAAIGGQVPVAIFSMEMSAEQLSFRMIGSIGRVNQSHLRTGRLTEEDWSRIDSAVSIMSNAPLYIDDSPGLTPTEVRARARRLKREHGLGLVVVDYLQLMQVAGNVENRATEISEISRSLKALAKELDVPVIALSQLNRSVEQRADKKPVMSDLRECVTGETLVCLADGRRAPIQSLVGSRPEVWCIDAERRVVTARADEVWRVGRRPVFRVELASGRSIRATAEHRLLAEQGWTTVRELRAGARLGVSGRVPEPVEPATNANHAGLSSAPSRADGAESRLLWDAITEVVPLGEAEVFDLTVPGPANWLADGIVSHNSGAIEQDADLIVFIYREEVYEPDTPRKGIADIIIGKQRNGPIGEFHLTFLGEFTKFENLVAEAYGDGVF